MSARETQQTWKVWVRIGVNEQTDFIEDITIYDCPDKPGYVLGRVTLEEPIDFDTLQESPK